MKRNPWLKFYVADWRADPGLRMCSAAARGVWIDLICLMHEAVPYGHLLVHGQPPEVAQLSYLTATPPEHLSECLAELESAGVFSRTREGVIYSRKLTRMASDSAKKRKSGKMGGNPSLLKQTEKDGVVKQHVKEVDKPRIQNPESREKIPKKEFDEFWMAYPRKVGKQAALRAYDRARRSSSAEEILEGTRRYAFAVRGKDPAYVKHPSGWLNDGRWADEAPSGQPGAPAFLSKEDLAERDRIRNGGQS